MNTQKVALKTEAFIFATMLGLPMSVAFLMWVADGTQRLGFADAHIISIRYTSSVLILMVLIAPIFRVAGTRKPGTPLTWGEAMVAAVYTFFVFFWLYGVVPHEWLTWCDSELLFRPDKYIIGPKGSWATWWSFWKIIPITIDKQKVRDLIAVVLYVIGLGGLIFMWSFWNDREKKAAESSAVEKSSQYGRPLVAPAGKG